MNEEEIAKMIAKIILDSQKPDHFGDAIKIGLPLLGAIIAAIVGYFSAKKSAEINKDTQIAITEKNSKTQLEAIDKTNSSQLDLVEKNKGIETSKAYEVRRSIRYEQLVDQLQKFNSSLTLHVTNVKNWIENRSLGREISERELSNLKNMENELHDAFLDLLGVEAKLLVCGGIKEQELVRKYGVKAQDIFKAVHIENKKIDVPSINSLMKEMRSMREEILLRIGESERLHNKVH